MKKNYFILLFVTVVFLFQEGFSQDSSNTSVTIPNKKIYSKVKLNDNSGGKGISIEVAHGQAFTDWTDAWAWVFSNNYLYHFNKRIAAGAGAGFQFDYTGLYPCFSVNSIFGNKVEGFAGSLDVNFIFSRVPDNFYEHFWPTVGVYYKNFFIKYMPSFLTGYEKEHFIQLGYSYYIKF